MEMKTYDRIEGETTKAWAAFCIYRDMGAARSHDRVAAEIYPPESPQNHPRNISQIERWSSAWKWAERCKDYDLDEEARYRNLLRAENDGEYLRKIESYRAHVEGVGMAILAISDKYLVSIDRRSSRIFAEIEAASIDGRSPNLTKAEEDFYLQIPSAIRSISASCLGGNQLSGDGLGIRLLINQRDEILDNN
jgi:hypothetical protein